MLFPAFLTSNLWGSTGISQRPTMFDAGGYHPLISKKYILIVYFYISLYLYKFNGKIPAFYPSETHHLWPFSGWPRRSIYWSSESSIFFILRTCGLVDGRRANIFPMNKHPIPLMMMTESYEIYLYIFPKNHSFISFCIHITPPIERWSQASLYLCRLSPSSARPLVNPPIGDSEEGLPKQIQVTKNVTIGQPYQKMARDDGFLMDFWMGILCHGIFMVFFDILPSGYLLHSHGKIHPF